MSISFHVDRRSFLKKSSASTLSFLSIFWVLRFKALFFISLQIVNENTTSSMTSKTQIENNFVVDVNRDFATSFARRLKVVNSLFTNFRKLQSISRRLTFNFVKKAKKKIRLTNESLNSSREITIKDHENFRIKVNEHSQTWMKTLNRMLKFWRVTKTQRLTIKEKFKEVTIRVEKLSRLNNAQIQNIIKFNEIIILNHSQVDNFKNEIV